MLQCRIIEAHCGSKISFDSKIGIRKYLKFLKRFKKIIYSENDDAGFHFSETEINEIAIQLTSMLTNQSSDPAEDSTISTGNIFPFHWPETLSERRKRSSGQRKERQVADFSFRELEFDEKFEFISLKQSLVK